MTIRMAGIGQGWSGGGTWETRLASGRVQANAGGYRLPTSSLDRLGETAAYLK